MTTQLTVTNPTRRRSWGWGYSTTPAPSFGIISPTAPEYIGTIGQVRAAIREDRNYHSFRSGGTHLASAWFYGGRKVLQVRYLDTWMSMTDAINLGIFDPESPFYDEYAAAVSLQVVE